MQPFCGHVDTSRLCPFLGPVGASHLCPFMVYVGVCHHHTCVPHMATIVFVLAVLSGTHLGSPDISPWITGSFCSRVTLHYTSPHDSPLQINITGSGTTFLCSFFLVETSCLCLAWLLWPLHHLLEVPLPLHCSSLTSFGCAVCLCRSPVPVVICTMSGHRKPVGTGTRTGLLFQ